MATRKKPLRSSEPTGPRPGSDPATSGRGAGPEKPDDLCRIWKERILREGKVYDTWAKRYEVDRLFQYYLGHQWRNLSETDAARKYCINLVFANVENQVPSLLFSRPKVSVDPQPTRAEDPASHVSARASLIERAVQTEIDRPGLHFKVHTQLALRDAYARFGVIEVGYTADYVDNPNVDKPVLQENDRELQDSATGKPLTQPARVPTAERLYLKRVPPQHVRVSPGQNILEENDWLAVAEWHHLEDVKGNPAYHNTAQLKATGTIAAQVDESERDPERLKHTGMVRLWKIYDLRTKVKHVLADGHPTMLLEHEPVPFLPFAALKFYEIADSFYPLPPLFNWISPQDELNESREMQRIHRRRFVRRYMRTGDVTQEEFDKLETGDDGVCIQVGKTDPPPIVPIQDAELGSSNWTQLAATKDDYSQIAGVSGEERGTPQADTATQANIINVRAQMRESSGRVLVGEWLASVARLILLTLRAHMQLPFMVRLAGDPFTPNPPEDAQTAMAWQEIRSEDIDGLDVDVRIDLSSLSPVAEQAQAQSWSVVLQLLTNPALMALLMTPNPEAPTEPSPLLRKTLVLNGIKSDQEIREIWRVGQVALAQAAAAAQAKTTAENQPDPPKVSIAFKGEDLAAPGYGPLVTAMFVQAEGLRQVQQQLAVQQAQQPPAVPPSTGEAAPGLAPLTTGAPGPTTGTPTAGAVGG